MVPRCYSKKWERTLKSTFIPISQIKLPKSYLFRKIDWVITLKCLIILLVREKFMPFYLSMAYINFYKTDEKKVWSNFCA